MISEQDIRKVILTFLKKRLENDKNYKSELTKLEQAQISGDLAAINESEQKIAELTKKFEFTTWMDDAAIRRVLWMTIATCISKGIHSSSLGSNVNYVSQTKPDNLYYVSSATPDSLPFDCSGNAAALDIFALLKQPIKDNVTLLQLIIDDHPAVLGALSDDKAKATCYLANFKKVIMDDFANCKNSELNKQLFWPNSEEPYLSGKEKNYRVLTPLHPSALCHLLYQKIQTRFSDENRAARDSRYKKSEQPQSYFSFQDLAVVKLGGSNPQGVSQLISNQGGRNFLLPSLPPIFDTKRPLSISKSQNTIFNGTLRYYCRLGFKKVFATVEATKNVVAERDNRKEGFGDILAALLIFARRIQTTFPAGWSRDYQLAMPQKYWLDPGRADLEGEIDFKTHYLQGDWVDELKEEFSFWVNTILKNKFKDKQDQFADPEFNEWCREFEHAVKASQRRKEGIF
ncbi:type I-F CRISPR-associated protein Csy1 [Orbaceae bacterium ESL0727]|nr:type I-F CRISPR-associated protein Csy1 [Orbaceae bacterium ESL0727]